MGVFRSLFSFVSMQGLHDSAAGMLEIREPSTTPPIWPAGNHKIANTVTYKHDTKQPNTNTNTNTKHVRSSK